MNLRELNVSKNVKFEEFNLERVPSKEAVTSRREAEKHYKIIRGLLFDNEIDELAYRTSKLKRCEKNKINARTLSQYE